MTKKEQGGCMAREIRKWMAAFAGINTYNRKCTGVWGRTVC